MTARLLTGIGIVLLFALPFAWHLAIDPPTTLPPWIAVVLHAAPMLPAFLLLLLRHRTAGYWGGIAALLLFCHGVMEAWTTPSARLPAWIEIALSVLVIVASSWDGLRARFAKRN